MDKKHHYQHCSQLIRINQVSRMKSTWQRLREQFPTKTILKNAHFLDLNLSLLFIYRQKW